MTSKRKKTSAADSSILSLLSDEENEESRAGGKNSRQKTEEVVKPGDEKAAAAAGAAAAGTAAPAAAGPPAPISLGDEKAPVDEPYISVLLKKQSPPGISWEHLKNISTGYSRADGRALSHYVRQALRPIDLGNECDQPGTESTITINFADKKAREAYFPDIEIVTKDGTALQFHKVVLSSAKYASPVWSTALTGDSKSAEIVVDHDTFTANTLLNWLYRLPRKRSEWFMAELTQRFEYQSISTFKAKLIALGLAAFAYGIADLQFEVCRVLTVLLIDVKLVEVLDILELFEKLKIAPELLATRWTRTLGVPPTDYKALDWRPTLTPTFARWCLTTIPMQYDSSIGMPLFSCFETVPKDETTLAGVAGIMARIYKIRVAHGICNAGSALNKWLKYAKEKNIPGLAEFTYHLAVAAFD